MQLLESIKQWEIEGKTESFVFAVRQDELENVKRDLEAIYDMEIEYFNAASDAIYYYPIWKVTIKGKRIFVEN